ncbi:hypothetical protein [Oceanicoccus sp. KOV_DT_Chl]|uniref:hypothetical protein n=1 Tax=Oceanicoccus sp. KOV_DT_Chl TaxID=1904639 RepID=UPI00135B48D4|nr:hypothetical protein [Oceanicoccus sp. KOV_DT_Chl]
MSGHLWAECQFNQLCEQRILKSENSDRVELPIKSEQPASLWIDSSHSYVSNSADNLATWIDRFFGDASEEEEAAYSSLRLTVEEEWEEYEGNSGAVRLRGKVHLPQLNERLSLVFADEKSEDGSEVERIGLQDNKENTSLALQYDALEKTNSRLDFRLSMRSSLKARVYARYRYDVPVAPDSPYRHRFIEKLYFIDGEGFGLDSRYQLDRVITDTRLLSWSNRAEFAEETDGVEWSSTTTISQRLEQQAAISSFVWISGETRPENLTKSYGLGVRYRSSFFRSWLFYEIEPAYGWLRDDIEANRKGTALFSIRLEILLDDL